MATICDASEADLPLVPEILGAGLLREVRRTFGRWLDLLFMQKLLPGPARPDG